jgi:hypothetical protein
MARKPKKDHRIANLSRRQEQAIKNSEIVLAEIAHGNPAEEESSTTVHKLVTELNKYL